MKNDEFENMLFGIGLYTATILFLFIISVVSISIYSRGIIHECEELGSSVLMHGTIDCKVRE